MSLPPRRRDDAGARHPLGAAEFEERYPRDPEGQEWAENSRFWQVYCDVAADWDEERLKTWNGDMDVLLVFAALFSAINTAFIIESYKLLLPSKPDYTQLAYLAIVAIAQNHSIPGLPTPPATTTSPTSTLSPKWVNGLWFSSVFFSLATAFLCILAKQWLSEFVVHSQDVDSKQSWGRLRQYRLDGLVTWHIAGFITMMPVLLHFSLFLYFSGLVVFLWQLDTSIAASMLVFTTAMLLFYFACLLLPLRWPNCAFRTPLGRVLFSYSLKLIPYIAAHFKWLAGVLEVQRDEVSSHREVIDADSLAWLSSTTSSPEVFGVVLNAVGALRMAVPCPNALNMGLRTANHLAGTSLPLALCAYGNKLSQDQQIDKTLNKQFLAASTCLIPADIWQTLWLHGGLCGLTISFLDTTVAGHRTLDHLDACLHSRSHSSSSLDDLGGLKFDISLISNHDAQKVLDWLEYKIHLRHEQQPSAQRICIMVVHCLQSNKDVLLEQALAQSACRIFGLHELAMTDNEEPHPVHFAHTLELQSHVIYRHGSLDIESQVPKADMVGALCQILRLMPWPASHMHINYFLDLVASDEFLISCHWPASILKLTIKYLTQTIRSLLPNNQDCGAHVKVINTILQLDWGEDIEDCMQLMKELFNYVGALVRLGHNDEYIWEQGIPEVILHLSRSPHYIPGTQNLGGAIRHVNVKPDRSLSNALDPGRVTEWVSAMLPIIASSVRGAPPMEELCRLLDSSRVMLQHHPTWEGWSMFMEDVSAVIPDRLAQITQEQHEGNYVNSLAMRWNILQNQWQELPSNVLATAII